MQPTTTEFKSKTKGMGSVQIEHGRIHHIILVK